MLSNPSFERSPGAQEDALYFKIEISWDYANNCNYRLIFDRFFPLFQ